MDFPMQWSNGRVEAAGRLGPGYPYTRRVGRIHGRSTHAHTKQIWRGGELLYSSVEREIIQSHTALLIPRIDCQRLEFS